MAIDEKFEMKNYTTILISALWSGKVDKYGYLAGEKILTSGQGYLIQQATFAYFPLIKTFEKQTKIIENKGKKQVEALQPLNSNSNSKSIADLFPKDILNKGDKYEILKIKIIGQRIIRNDLIYKTGNKK